MWRIQTQGGDEYSLSYPVSPETKTYYVKEKQPGAAQLTNGRGSRSRIRPQQLCRLIKKSSWSQTAEAEQKHASKVGGPPFIVANRNLQSSSCLKVHRKYAP